MSNRAGLSRDIADRKRDAAVKARARQEALQTVADCDAAIAAVQASGMPAEARDLALTTLRAKRAEGEWALEV